MNAYAIFAVNDHLGSLLDEAAERRAREARTQRGRGRFARILASLSRSIDSAAESAPRLVPTLTDYPYRS